jgi:1,4-alpha-glucan branching enzyme
MNRAEVEALASGRHGDPFRLLGPHHVEAEDEPAHWEVRAWLPQAISAQVLLPDGDAVPMEREFVPGFFVAEMPNHPGAYRLRLERYDGSICDMEDPYRFPPMLTPFELHLHGEGTHHEAYNTLGAHLAECEGCSGVRFAVWAPSAQSVAVTGEFNDWDATRHPMRLRDGGIWEIFLPGIGVGALYKYSVRSQFGLTQLKADPYAFYAEVPPRTASIVYDLSRYQWNDQQWLERRAQADILHEPVSIYEVHLESWLRGPHNQPLSYRELAATLVPYAKDMGFTHLELLPIAEHPFSGSWGYQVTGYYAPTSRFGTPDDFRYFIDQCHQAGLGVIIDWVPGHFPKDAHGLAYFDGTHLYEHRDPRQGEHKDWGTLIFNYGRNEVRTFLLSNALFWIEQFHIDGFRVDAVASMLYLDYSRQPGEWIPNRYGGRENLEAIDFLRRFNELIHQLPGVISVAEESTSWPGVSRPVYLDGLGFTMKWNMGWMHDMLKYFSEDPVHRKYHHNNITFSLLYAFTENFLLPISHDEVVHLKRSLIGKMPGDEWQRYANTRAFFAYMYTHPGKKLQFMGCEIGQPTEWNYAASLPWHLLQYDFHRKLQVFVKELNWLYRHQPALYEVDYHWAGFEWIDFHDIENSVISFVRFAKDRNDFLVIICNFTPVVRHSYRIGVPRAGGYSEILNSDAAMFGGSNVGNGGRVEAEPQPAHGRPASLLLTLPPLGVLILKPDPLPSLPPPEAGEEDYDEDHEIELFTDEESPSASAPA